MLLTKSKDKILWLNYILQKYIPDLEESPYMETSTAIYRLSNGDYLHVRVRLDNIIRVVIINLDVETNFVVELTLDDPVDLFVKTVGLAITLSLAHKL